MTLLVVLLVMSAFGVAAGLIGRAKHRDPVAFFF
jgi:hypothetical protein